MNARHRYRCTHRRRTFLTRLIIILFIGAGWIWAGLPGDIYWYLVMAFYVIRWTRILVSDALYHYHHAKERNR